MAGLDFYVGGVCWGEEPLCMLLRQLSFSRSHFRNSSKYFYFFLNQSMLWIWKSGSTEIFNKIRKSNAEVIKKTGDPINGFSRFTLVGRQTCAVICDRCDVIDASFGNRDKINLETYPGELHVCLSRERKRHQVTVK